MPVPSVSPTTCVAPRAAPNRCSDQRHHVGVVVDEHRQPEPLAHGVAEGKSAMSRLTAITATPVGWSIRQGMPKPTASTSGRCSRSSVDRVDDHVHDLAPGACPRRCGGRARDLQLLVHDSRRAAWCRPGRRRSPFGACCRSRLQDSGTIEGRTRRTAKVAAEPPVSIAA